MQNKRKLVRMKLWGMLKELKVGCLRCSLQRKLRRSRYTQTKKRAVGERMLTANSCCP
jgi:hypothetical protein